MNANPDRSGWYVTGLATRISRTMRYRERRITLGPFAWKQDAERERDHYLFGPYVCRGVKIRFHQKEPAR
jgi:hypothetical protein